jgi:hypothetical protein
MLRTTGNRRRSLIHNQLYDNGWDESRYELQPNGDRIPLWCDERRLDR